MCKRLAVSEPQEAMGLCVLTGPPKAGARMTSRTSIEFSYHVVP